MAHSEDGGPRSVSKPPLTQQQRRLLEEDDRRRMLQNVAAFAFIVVLLVFGAWLIDRLAAWNRNMSCLQSHHRNCG